MPYNLVLPVWFTLALAGGLGQLLRAVPGVKKAINKGEEIKISRLLGTLGFAFTTGGIIGYFYGDWRLAFAGGYGTTDFAESLIKVITTGVKKNQAQPSVRPAGKEDLKEVAEVIKG